jgi:hypothetical protein
MNSIHCHRNHWILFFSLLFLFGASSHTFAQTIDWYLVWDDGEEVPYGTWTREWNETAPQRLKVVLNDFNEGTVIPYSWNREITNDLTLADRIASGTGTYTYTNLGEEEIFYIELDLPEAAPENWGDPNAYDMYTFTMQASIDGYIDTKTWYQWWAYTAPEQTGTCTSLTKNGIDVSETWSMEWGATGGDDINPKYTEEDGWYDEIILTVDDLTAPVTWSWQIQSLSDTDLPQITMSGVINPSGGTQVETITIPYPDPGCIWGSPGSNGLYEIQIDLTLSLCDDQSWVYSWDSECDPCPGDLNISPETLGYMSTSDFPPLDFPGYEWPEEGFDNMPDHMIAMASYFKSVLITNGVERAFPGWCVDLYTLLDYGQLYTDGDVTLHRTLNLDLDGDGFADVDPVTGTTSNLLINVNGDIIGAPENLARVNYIMNQYYRGNYEDYGVTYAEIQAAIWELLSIGQSSEHGYSQIEIDPDTGYGTGGLIMWDDNLKDLIIQDAMQEGVETYSPTQCELMGVVAQTGEGTQTVMIMMPYCLYQCFHSYALVTAGISNHPDGLASSGEGLTFPCVTGIVAAGTGMHSLEEGIPGVINIEVPGTVKRALLYWEGESSHGTPHGAIDSMIVNGVPKYGIMIGGPTKFFSSGGNGDIIFQSYRADVTDLVVEGANTLILEGTDFDYPVDDAADGAGLLVIYENEGNDSEVYVRDGQDLAYHGFSGELRYTEPQVFTFEATDYDRTAQLILLVGSVACGSTYRPNEAIIISGGVETIVYDPLGGHDGCEWDTETLEVTIPAGATSLSVEIVSTDSYSPNGASMAWVGAALSVPDVCGVGEPQTTTSGLIEVDGNIDDWNLEEDFFSNMYRAANPDKAIESFLYLKYDDENDVLYSLVLGKDGVPVLEMPDDAFIKIDDIKQVDGNFGDDDITPDFAWVYDENNNLIGWESSTPQENGVYDLNVHTQVYDDGEDQTSAVADRSIPLVISDSILKPIFLVIDEDSIDNGNEPNFFSDVEVNDDIADIGVRDQLQYFSEHIGEELTLFTGEVGDEGWFALKSIPLDWIYTGPTNDGVANFIQAGIGLGTSGQGKSSEEYLDSIPDVTPLRATGLDMLEGKTICAIVYDSDVSINYDPLTGSLMGANLGIVAFEVLSTESNTGYSSSSLPKVNIKILDADVIKTLPMELMQDVPVPISSSEPFDVDPPSAFSSDVVAYWNFDEGSNIIAEDSTENNHDGVLINDPSWTSGQTNNGIDFNGVDNYVDMGSFDVESTEITLCAWINANQFDHLGGNDARIISKAIGTAEADHYWMLSTIDSGGNTRLRFRLKTYNGTTSTLIADSGNLSTGVWIHVAAVYDGNYMILYKDGEEVGRMAKSGTVAVNDLIPVWVGNNPPSASSRPFKGVIDEVRVYNRALSQADIQDVMSGEQSFPTPTPTDTPVVTDTPTPTATPTITPSPTPIAMADVVAYWNFNEGSGSLLNDLTANNHDGTLSNGASWRLGQEDWGGAFDGYNDYIDVGNFDVVGSGLTIAGWMYADRFDHLGYRDARIISKTTSTDEQDHYWMLSTRGVDSDTRLRFRLKTNGTTTTYIADSGNLSTGVWTHVAAVYDGSNMILYKDGVEVGRTAKTGTIDTNPAIPIWIGNNPTNANRPWDGIIDGLIIYNRGLSQTEIQNLMNGTGLPTVKVYTYPSQYYPGQPTATPTVTPTPTMTPIPSPTIPDQWGRHKQK